MMASVMCPVCQHKQWLPESEMGKLQSCPNCQSSFVAGKSAAESRGGPPGPPAASSPQPPPSYARTMLADAAAPPIKYNCPRCKAPLEAPASQANTKINCPHCSQRLQVPPAPTRPAAPAPAPGLNKTMLASDESLAPPPPPLPPIKFKCPNCHRPLEAPANEAGTKKNCTYCSQRLQVPAAPTAPAAGLNKTRLASADDGEGFGTAPSPGTGARGAASPAPGGKEQPDVKGGSVIPLTPRNVAIGVVLLLLLVLLVPALIGGGKRTDTEALARAQIELEKLKAEIELKKGEIERQKAAEAETRRQLEDMLNKMRAQEEKRAADQLAYLRTVADQNKKAELEEKFNAERRKMDEEKREMERKQQQLLEDVKRKLDENQRALDAAQQKQQTIIQQPAPVVYYPPYHPRYYWPWW